MNIDKTTINNWMSGQTIAGVHYNLNECVRCNAGDSEIIGSVISLISLTPEPEYLVESGTDGSDLRVRQTHLNRIDE